MEITRNQDVVDPSFMELYQIVQNHEEIIKEITECLKAENSAPYDIHAGEPTPVDRAAYYDPILDSWCFL